MEGHAHPARFWLLMFLLMLMVLMVRLHAPPAASRSPRTRAGECRTKLCAARASRIQARTPSRPAHLPHMEVEGVEAGSGGGSVAQLQQRPAHAQAAELRRGSERGVGGGALVRVDAWVRACACAGMGAGAAIASQGMGWGPSKAHARAHVRTHARAHVATRMHLCIHGHVRQVGCVGWRGQRGDLHAWARARACQAGATRRSAHTGKCLAGPHPAAGGPC